MLFNTHVDCSWIGWSDQQLPRIPKKFLEEKKLFHKFDFLHTFGNSLFWLGKVCLAYKSCVAFCGFLAKSDYTGWDFDSAMNCSDETRWAGGCDDFLLGVGSPWRRISLRRVPDSLVGRSRVRLIALRFGTRNNDGVEYTRRLSLFSFEHGLAVPLIVGLNGHLIGHLTGAWGCTIAL